jgi:WG containing repeat
VQKIIAIIALLVNLTTTGQSPANKDILIRMEDSTAGTYGYRTVKGNILIPLGKYMECFSDTFRNYAIVFKSGNGIVAIDRQEHVLYNVFIFDNGPDDPSDGYFRITHDGKVGYADSFTGKIIIKPQFGCAWPFEHGVAKVSLECRTKSDG